MVWQLKNDRLFQLLYLLLGKGSLTAPELSERLEVSVRTVYRDVETLSLSGVPIYSAPGRGGGISILPGYSFDKALLSVEEQDQLLFAVQSLQAADQNVDGLLRKLGSSFKKTGTDWISVDFSRWGMHREDNARFDQIKKAIIGREILEFGYCGTSGKLSRRKIHPLKLIYKDKHWYLQGYCLKAKDFRLFKLGRILELTNTGEYFTQDYSGSIPEIEPELVHYPGTKIRLKFSSEIAFRVYDEFDNREIVSQADGSLIVSVSFPIDSWVISYLLSFGSSVEILEPSILKDKLCSFAKEIYEHHKT